MKVTPGTIAVVTGAGSGIGRALALNLAGKGCALALADVNADSLAETATMIGQTSARVTTHHVDVSDQRAVEQFASEVVEAHGGASLLINNAGVALGGTFAEVTL